MSDPQQPRRSSPLSPADEERHRRLIAAESKRLQRELRALGPMPTERLAELCHADHWQEGTLEEAIAEGVRRGELRRLPLGWVASVDT